MNIKNINFEHVSVFSVIGLIALATLLFAYTIFAPVDVLKNWTITTDKTMYSVGDTIVSTSRYNKVMSVNGQSKRYIECLNQIGSWVRYPVLEQTADRKQGQGQTSTSTHISGVVPNVDTTCRIYTQVEYTIYMYRPFREENVSNEFKLVKKEGVSVTPMPSTVNSGVPFIPVGDIEDEPIRTDVSEPPATVTQENPAEPQPGPIRQIIEDIINKIIGR